MAVKSSVRPRRKNNNGVSGRAKGDCNSVIPASRLQLIEDIRSDIRNGENVMIVGESGSGKSFIIERLSKDVVKYPTLKRILSKVGKGKSSFEMMENAKGIVFVDNIDELPRNQWKYLKELFKRVQIVATAKKVLFPNEFKVYKLKPLSKFEAYAIAKKCGASDPMKIAKMSNGNIGHLIRLINGKTQRPHFKRIDLLKSKYLIPIAFSLMVLKYHEYIHSAFELGYLFAMTSYLILTIERIKRN